MSIYSYIEQDHEKAKDIMNQIVTLGDEETQKRTDLFNTLKEEIIIHSKSEEEAFYKPLRQFNKTQDEVAHGKEEHEEAEGLLKELTDSSLTGAAWMQKFKKLKEALEHHMKEEENEIFDDAKKVLNPETESKMEEDMKAAKAKLEETKTIKNRDAA